MSYRCSKCGTKLNKERRLIHVIRNDRMPNGSLLSSSSVAVRGDPTCHIQRTCA
jgi:hypothetical protein